MAESSIDQLLETAKEHHKAKRYDEAEPLYRRYLAMRPQSADAAHLLGYLLFETGKAEAGAELIRRAIAYQPDKAEFHCNLGVVQLRLNRFEEAIEALLKALELRPDFPEAWYNLGSTQFGRNKIPEAIENYKKAIVLRPTYADAYNNLGSVLIVEGKFEEAIAAYEQALALRPNDPLVSCNLGVTLRKVGRLEEAIAYLRQAVAMEPEYRDACKNLAYLLRERGQWSEAIAMFRRALYLHNGNLEVEEALAESLRGAGEYEEAVGVYQKNLSKQPGWARAQRGLGQTYEAMGNLTKAAQSYREALKVKPDYIEAACDLGNAKLAMGDVEGALRCFDDAIGRRPTDPLPYSCRLIALHYLPDLDPAVVHHEHVDWNQKHAMPLSYEIRPHDVDRDPDRRLRIGYVSPDFREDSVGFFIESLLAAHDPSQVELFGYADLPRSDDTTIRIQKLFHNWRNTTGISDLNLSEMIRADKIDILIDLAGHTAGNRLLVFARKPAPIQVTYLGYPATTGMSAMDYRLTDIHADPPGMTEGYYSEKLLRMPRSFVCYRPPEGTPEVSVLPAKKKGYITFGSFNNLAKMNEKITHLWVQILKAVPGSRLLIKNSGLSDQQTREEFLRRFTSEGIEATRIDLRSQSPTILEHLKTYEEVDIGLDTYPYNGTTTSCEAMWMGVPVVMLVGTTHAGRVGLSLLTNVNLPELAADSDENYVRVVVDLTSDIEALAEIRQNMRGWMNESPVMMGRRLAWNLEFQLRNAWKEWVAGAVAPVGA
jgi:protein O-GlcNAc transferase